MSLLNALNTILSKLEKDEFANEQAITSGAGTLIVPNAAVLIAGAPHPDEAKKFIEYLLSAEVEQALAASEAAQMPLRPGVPVPPGVRRLDEIAALTVDYGTLAERLETLSRGFLKEWTAQP